jgi:hypothetical protein
MKKRLAGAEEILYQSGDSLRPRDLHDDRRLDPRPARQERPDEVPRTEVAGENESSFARLPALDNRPGSLDREVDAPGNLSSCSRSK